MYRNNYSRGATPRDRLDPRLLERLALRSELPSDLTEECMCGQSARNRSRSGYSNNTRTTDNNTNRGSCQNNTRAAEYEGINNGCGCKNNARSSENENDKSECGYNRMMRSRTSCGCNNNTSTADYENRNSRCGCENNARAAEYESANDGCDCENYEAEYDHSLAMVYSPMQQWQNLYCEEEGLAAGTIFRELDKPFYGSKCHGGKDYE